MRNGQGRMFSHVTIGTNDVARAKEFYSDVLGLLGLPLSSTEGQLMLFYRDLAEGLVCIGPPFDGNPATVGNGMMVAFNAPDRPTVDRFHAAALAAGGTDEGEPKLRPHYHPDYYGAYVRDPDGNKLCCVCHLPPPDGSA